MTPPDVKPWFKISLIEASRFDSGTAYVAVDAHRLDDRTPYAYRTRDYGKTWTRITGGISDPDFVYVVREDPRHKGLLFAGTDFGIKVSFDDGDHWQPLQLNLPAVSVRDIDVHGDDLVIATHGRAFWIMDDIAPLRQIAEARPRAVRSSTSLQPPSVSITTLSRARASRSTSRPPRTQPKARWWITICLPLRRQSPSKSTT